METKPEFTFPVVNGMVAVEHVRYLRDGADSLAKELRWALAMLHVMSDKADPVSYASYRTGIQNCREALTAWEKR